MKRFNAVSRGQAHAFKKRMTHIRIVLTDEKKAVPAGKQK
jgi:ribosomal protein L22